MVYVIETTYVGADEDVLANPTIVRISTTPAKKNMSGKVCINGWCGTSNNYNVNAHGSFENIEDAYKYIVDTFGKVHSANLPEDRFNDIVIKEYWLGEYPFMSASETRDFINEVVKQDVDANTTDDSLDELVKSYNTDAIKSTGYSLSPDIKQILIESRAIIS